MDVLLHFLCLVVLSGRSAQPSLLLLQWSNFKDTAEAL
jgi:hypothetical protein